MVEDSNSRTATTWVDRCLERYFLFPPITDRNNATPSIQLFFWWMVEWVVAWVVVTLCAIRYCFDFLLVQIHIRFVLQRAPDQWCGGGEIPLTVVAQTRKEQAKTWQSELHSLTELLERKQHQTRKEQAKTWQSELHSLTELLERKQHQQHNMKESQRDKKSNSTLCSILKENTEARRIASSLMMKMSAAKSQSCLSPSESALIEELRHRWPELLRESSRQASTTKGYAFELSVILPVYKERCCDILFTLQHAIQHCCHPNQIQILIVQCCSSNTKELTVMKTSLERNNNELPCEKNKIKQWAKVEVLPFPNSTGRGSCLNYGAQRAQGRILTCLHADTQLPQNWDRMILETFDRNNHLPKSKPQTGDDVAKGRRREGIFVHVCAFEMAIDMSSRALGGQPRRPGLVGAQLLGSLRCKLCSMPYGDSALSFPASFLESIGWFPDQPLMEDYEMAALLRKRAALLGEELVILPGRALCSPRRWQRYGVSYTTLINALCIWRYKHGASAEDLFELYYKRKPKVASETKKK